MSFGLLAAHHENLTIAVSMLAFAVSLFSLGWNVYRDVVLKPRFRVRFAIYHWWRDEGTHRARPPEYHLTVVNHGPGTATVEATVVKTRLAKLVWSWNSNDVHKVPQELKPGQLTIITVSPTESLIEDTKPLRIGVQDAFGRVHWAPRKDLEKAKREYAQLKEKSASVNQDS
jgi:hypothetical protein